MNNNIVRIVAVIILLSPWLYISSIYKDVLFLVLGVVLLLATVDMSKKKNTENKKTIENTTENKTQSRDNGMSNNGMQSNRSL